MANLIPKISLDSLLKNDQSTIKVLSDALENHGFFVLTDHGISNELFKNAYAFSEKFFALDLSKKNALSHPEKAGARGYTPFGKETALGETVPDLKEFWHHGPVIDDTYDKRIMSNVEVNDLDGFDETFNQLFEELNGLGMKLLSSISLTLDKPSNFFNSKVEKGNSLLRLIHYPPSNNDNMFRAREHEDINLITLLIGADEPGLEVKEKTGKWIPVSSSFNEIVCNIGDMMQLVTDKKLKSTTHRVIQDKKSESKPRYSIPFFLHPAPSINLKSIYRNDDEGILADDFLNQRLKEIKLY